MKNLASLTVLMRFNGDFKSVLLFRPPCTVYIIRTTGNRNRDYINVKFAKKYEQVQQRQLHTVVQNVIHHRVITKSY